MELIMSVLFLLVVFSFIFGVISLAYIADHGVNVIAITIVAIFFCICFGSYNYMNAIDEPETKYMRIYSLDCGVGATGSFILGSGSINSELVYICLLYYGNNTYSQYIIEDKHKDIIIVEDPFLHDFGYVKWAEGKLSGDSLPKGEQNIEIHVPKGTIIKNFNINGE